MDGGRRVLRSLRESVTASLPLVHAAGALSAPVMAGAGAPRERAALLFSGADEAELANARAQWKELREAGYSLAYHQQDDAGKWIEKAREPKS